MPRRGSDAADDRGAREVAGVLPLSALDERVAIVGTSGSGKTYAAKGMVELLLDQQARVCVVDPLGVWWGLRAGADGMAPGYPVVVFGGRHADVVLHEAMGAALGRLVGTHAIACVVDLSELGSSAARRRFMAAFAEAVYEANAEPLHLVLDEADLWAPQRPMPEGMALLGRIEEIVRRGRVRGFIPWLITQRPAVVHKDVLSQADILVMMKLTSSQDRDAVGGWIEGQADRAEGRRILAELPRLARGEGYLWAPSDGVLARVAFPAIRTYDSSRTPRRGERLATPRTLAEVDLSAITAALAAVDAPGTSMDGGQEVARPAGGSRKRLTIQEQTLTEQGRMLTAAQARVAALEAELARLQARLGQIAILAADAAADAAQPATPPEPPPVSPPPLRGDRAPEPPTSGTPVASGMERQQAGSVGAEARPSDPGGALHPAARKLLAALAQHTPARFTWGQAATLAGLKAGTSTPDASNCALWALSRKRPTSSQPVQRVWTLPARCRRRRPPRSSGWRCGASGYPARRRRCCAALPPMAGATRRRPTLPQCWARSRPAGTGTAAWPCCATTAWSRSAANACGSASCSGDRRAS